MTILTSNFIADLETELAKPLPGEAVRQRLSPPYRPRLSHEEIAKNNPKIGGVLLLLYEKNEQLHLVFTERKKYDGVHSGQISLPGGRKDEADNDLIQTALREAEEEVGVSPKSIQVLGKLTELYIPPSNFLVYPSVGYCSSSVVFKPHDIEVEQIVEIPLMFFLNEMNINSQTKIKLNNNTVVVVPAYIFNQHIIWGATAIILSEFVHVVQAITNTQGT